MQQGERDRDFLTKEPVEGRTLADRLAEMPLTPSEILQFAIELGSVLQSAHARKLVHGSLSPDSILITGAGIKVVEPGLHPDPNTAPYRAPEQVVGEKPDTRSDIFAYGAILYEMAAGTRAFPGEGAQLDNAILEGPPPHLPAGAPLEAVLGPVIASCLEKSPAARRQRIQNAVIELRFASRSIPRTAEARPPRKPVRSRQTPVAPPNPDAFLLGPGEKMPTLVAPRPRPWLERLVPIAPERGQAAPGLGGFSFRSFGIQFWAASAVMLVLLTATAVGAVVFLHRRPASPVLKFAVSPPERTTYPGSPAVSPDGHNLVFSAIGPEGVRMLWIRPLDALRASTIPGTEGATSPFWSPDSRSVGLFANGALKTVKLDGSNNPPATLCPADNMAGGGTWNADGTIVFAPGLSGGLLRVAATGGKPQPLLSPNTAKSESAYLWPQFLPDGKHFLFYVMSDLAGSTGVYAGALDSSEYKMLFPSETNAVYSSFPEDKSRKNGYLLYVKEHSLMGQSFDAGRLGLAGEPIRLADDIAAIRSLALAPISVSDGATLVYQVLGSPTRQLVWFNRSGTQSAAVREPGDWGPPRIAPDGKRAVVARMGSDQNAHLWIVDQKGEATQLTGGSYHEGSPVWSPDGSRIASFLSDRAENKYDLFVRTADGSKLEPLYRSVFPKYPTDWSRDGRWVLFSVDGEGTRKDVWAYSTGEHRAGPVVDTVHGEEYAALSPDGKWLAFHSDESGRNDVYVEPFRGIDSSLKQRWRVSPSGGGMPRWRADGKELYYLTASGRMMAVPVHPAGDEFGFDAPATLFQTRPIPKTWNLYDVSPDGQHFLLNLPLEWPNSASITVVTNWTEKLKN